MTVYFHANFGLNRTRMATLVNRALDNPELRDDELAHPFGYKAPFSARYRSWLNKTGIIQLGMPVILTPKGQVVWENDPKFEMLTTQWFMHWELTEDPTHAEAWHFFIHEFLPSHTSFTIDELINGIMMKLRWHSEEHFGPDSKLNPVIARKLVECYAETEALGNLGIVEKRDNLLLKGRDLMEKGPWITVDELQSSYIRKS